jgi:hypothetical protein
VYNVHIDNLYIVLTLGPLPRPCNRYKLEKEISRLILIDRIPTRLAIQRAREMFPRTSSYAEKVRGEKNIRVPTGTTNNCKPMSSRTMGHTAGDSCVWMTSPAAFLSYVAGDVDERGTTPLRKPASEIGGC